MVGEVGSTHGTPVILYQDTLSQKGCCISIPKIFF